MASPRVTRRWVLVAAGTAAILGAAATTLPASGSDEPAEALRARVLAGLPAHVGYAESTGRLGLPEIPALERVTALFTGVTQLRAYVAGPDLWRVDELTPAGERDTYRRADREYLWDFGANQLTTVTGETPVRLPRAGDLVPSELARRLVGLTRSDPVTSLGRRRIAGFSAAGFRTTPVDPDTTVGRIDVWCDPASGLPLRVEVAARTDDRPLLFTEFLEVALTTPDDRTLTPAVPPGAGSVTAEAADLAGALRQLDAPDPPARLAGRDRVPLGAGLPGVGVYGAGVSGFVLVPASRGIADRVIDGAPSAGGVTVDVPVGRAVRLTTPLLSVVARGGVRRGGVLLAGTVAPEVLEQAVRELPGRRA
ncbi:hypothetical protein ACFQH9_28640 [Pseudonocardia lutea]|jgi:hypothetical protein|uniref:MucB/RseB N-terminal domain-containing protein n=1 Tax=Pseudonocardia lutea TaxID=2172015 RepID=A0ABW1IHJ0_9PSEU